MSIEKEIEFSQAFDAETDWEAINVLRGVRARIKSLIYPNSSSFPPLRSDKRNEDERVKAFIMR